MGPNFTPLQIPHSPAPPPKRKGSPNKNIFALLAALVLMVGMVGGYFALNSGLTYKSRATGINVPSCPSGTQLMINVDTHIGTENPGQWDATPMAPNGKVTGITGHWLTQSINGVWMMGDTGSTLKVTYPSPVILDTVLMFDNSNSPWKINGVTLPATAPGEWGSYKLDLKTTEMNFDINGAPSHLFNVCVRTAPAATATPAPSATPKPSATSAPNATPKPSSSPAPSATPKPSGTPAPSVTNSCPKPNPVRNLRITCPICKGA